MDKFTPEEIENKKTNDFTYGTNYQKKNKINKASFITNVMPSYTPVNYWNVITSLQWMDKSDGIMNVNDKLEIINRKCDMSLFKSFINERIAELRVKFHNHVVLQLKKEVQIAFFTHIILKGRDFFDAVVSDIGFAEYLLECNEYQILL